MKKTGILTLGIVLLCIGMKFNSMAMSSGLSGANVAALNDQIKEIDATMVKKEKELESASHIEEFALVKELNALRKKRIELKRRLQLPSSMEQSLQQKAGELIPAPECRLSEKFINFLYSKAIKVTHAITPLSTLGTKAIAWSPDGTKLAIQSHAHGAGGASDLRIWDIATRSPIHQTIHNHNPHAAISWSPDGKKVATSSINSVTIYSVEDSTFGTPFVIPTGYTPRLLTWNPVDINQIAIAEKSYDKVNNADILNVATSTSLHIEKRYSLDAMAWSPDGNKLALGTQNEKRRIEILDIANKKITNFSYHSIILEGRVAQLAWSPDGSRLAIGFFNEMGIWDVATGRRVDNGLPDIGYAQSISWSPDSTKLAIAGSSHQVMIDAITCNQFEPELFYKLPMDAQVAWNPDGASLAEITQIGGRYQVRVWDTSICLFNWATLTIDQCDLLKAFEIMFWREQFRKPPTPIQATEEQWYTFTTFPKPMRDALHSFIQEPTRTHPPKLKENKQHKMDERINKALEQMWEREATAK